MKQTISPIFLLAMLVGRLFNKLLEIYDPVVADINYLCSMDETINDIVENDKLKRKIIDYLETERSLKNISSYENDNNNFKINKGNLEYKFTIRLGENI